jgi:hypothetical protein
MAENDVNGHWVVRAGWLLFPALYLRQCFKLEASSTDPGSPLGRYLELLSPEKYDFEALRPEVYERAEQVARMLPIHQLVYPPGADRDQEIRFEQDQGFRALCIVEWYWAGIEIPVDYVGDVLKKVLEE